MGIATLRKEVEKLKAKLTQQQPQVVSQVLQKIKANPATLLTAAGLTPDPWQTNLLQSTYARTLLLCSRQSGKSTVAAALALREALLCPGSLVLILSPSQRQSAELFQAKVLPMYRDLGRPIPVNNESALRMELANGSRIISLPGKEETVRCFSGVKLLIIDEASRVPDALYYSVRPMLAVSKGSIVRLTTPYGKRGWFYQDWIGPGNWHRVKKTAADCPRITKEFLQDELAHLGHRWYRQEYFCEFEEVVDAVFLEADIQAAIANDIAPLF